jgi:hypothetical protein
MLIVGNVPVVRFFLGLHFGERSSEVGCVLGRAKFYSPRGNRNRFEILGEASAWKRRKSVR